MNENVPPPTATPGEAQPRPRLLVADDEESMRFYLERALRRHGYEVEVVDNGDAAIERYEARRFDVAVVDLKMPGTHGIEVLARVRTTDPEAMVIIMTAYGTIQSAVEAMRQGAFDYITKPFEIDELLLRLERALRQRTTLRENRELRRLVENRSAYAGLIGQSAAMRAVFQTIDVLRTSAATVLIYGESGTGKELVARAIHVNSSRSQGAFVALNCAAIPSTLLESELFGHEAGAFTGAHKRKRGLVERADGGTLFLDEVSEIPLVAQAKLVRFLQEREFTPLGSSESVRIDLRVIAATNQDLERAVAEGQFRQDLFWRLNVVPIHLPPLRERREDIPVLVAHFVERYRRAAGSPLKGLSVEALILLTNYGWPGNVRELENTIERMVVLNAEREELDIDALPESIRGLREGSAATLARDDVTPFERALNRFEREYLVTLFEQTKGNVSQAAKISGISRANLHRKAKQLDVDPDRFREGHGSPAERPPAP
ncbi:MAG: sigma-54 dependent transcriptional regulator [Planctomycetota bacterium]